MGQVDVVRFQVPQGAQRLAFYVQIPFSDELHRRGIHGIDRRVSPYHKLR